MAALLFLENGYAGTSLETIAAKAKIGKHTLYRRFPDKRTLFAAVIKRGSADVEAVAEPRAGLTPLENLRALITAAVETLTRPYALQFMRMVIAEGTRFPELAQEYSRNADDSIVQAAEKLISSAQDAGELPHGEAEWLARMCLSMTVGVIFQASLTAENRFSTAEAREGHVEKAWRLFLDGAGHRGKPNPD